RSSALGIVLLIFGILLFVGVSTAFGLQLSGKFDFRSLWAEKGYVPPPGTVPVLLTTKEVPPYTKISRDHIFDAKGKPNLFYLTPKEIEEKGIYTDFNKILGRVTSQEVRAGYAFSEKNLLPEGTRPGIAGGVPVGKRALVIEAGKINGVHSLKAGDHVDLIASFHLDASKNDKVMQALYTAEQGGTPKKKANVKVLAENSVVVKQVFLRQSPTTTSSLTQGMRTQMKPVEEIILALSPEEIAGLTEAMAIGADIVAVTRSGQPGGDTEPSSIQPKAPPAPKVATIEMISGSKRDMVVVPLTQYVQGSDLRPTAHAETPSPSKLPLPERLP
ncbi:MAG: RcpC/CpaB family pilus assembly protein, partial [Gemmataceae bacterium]